MSKGVIRTLIFDRRGAQLDEIEPTWSYVTWRLNRVNRAEFFLPYTDSKCTSTNLELGNRVLLTFDNGLPSWGGVVDVPRRRRADGISVFLYGGAQILSWRRTPKTQSFASVIPGEIFRSLIETANATWATGIEPGQIYPAGTPRTETYHYANILDAVVSLQKLSGEDWEIVPILEKGRLIFLANWYERRGTDKYRSTLLEEGASIDAPAMDEQGPIANKIYLPGGGAGGTTWADRYVGEAANAASQGKYDFRELAAVQSGVSDQATLNASAQALIDELGLPRERATISATDKEPAPFGVYAVGDRVRLRAYLQSAWAYDGRVRIVTREWAPRNTCRLEVVGWSE